MTSAKPAFDEIDISTHEFWARPFGDREQAFAVLRRERPVSWQRPAESIMMEPVHDGFWAVAKHADIVTVSRDSGVFSSAAEHGGVSMEDVPPEVVAGISSIIAMDDPEHQRQRRLISSVFTPRRVAMIEDQIKNQARQIVDDLAPLGEADFVDAVAKRLPMWTISEMLGVPEELRETVAETGNAIIGASDDADGDDDDHDDQDGRDLGEAVFTAMLRQHEIMSTLIAERRAVPQDDLITALVQAEIDGEKLADEELHAFLALLGLGGNDTTRHTTSHAMKALTDFPEQRALLLADLPGRMPTAVEEFLRWATTVMTFRRTALRDVELGGRQIKAGDRLVMIYPSGNRDEEVFHDPYRFDVTRTPNQHVAFGGGGPHFCLGSHLARTQLRAILGELLSRLPDLEAGEPEFLSGNAVHGIKRMPCTFTPARGAGG